MKLGIISIAVGLALTPGAEVWAIGPDEVAVPLHEIERSNVRVVKGASGKLTTTFLPAEWPNLKVKPSRPADWSRFGRLLIDLENPGPRAITFGVRVDDDPASDGLVHCRTADGSIGPGEFVTIAVAFDKDPMDVGMRGLPRPPGVRALPTTGKGPFDLRHIVAFQVFLHLPKEPETLRIGNVRLGPGQTLDGIVDAFGQYTRADWPGKLKSADELTRRRAAEDADLRSHPHLPDRDKYGGWASGPKLAASGAFRTEKVGNRWWLVDPDGHLFFSTGIDTVDPNAATFITGREAMFTCLPDARSPLARHFGMTENVHSGPVKNGRTFDFYRANLERKYGPDYLATWKAVTLRRLPSWGFNTIGNWSDHFHRNGGVPYVATVWIRGDHARVSSGSDYWGKMHDPFDPRFATDVARSVKENADEVRGDPWCLGYFVDNELSWGGTHDDAERCGLALGTLAEGPGSPAKAAFLDRLRRRYGAIAKLNAAWGTKLAGWEALESPFTPARPFAAGLKDDLSTFVKEFARRYFTTVRDQLRRLDPGHLYLGCRFSTARTPEAIEAAAESCDVVSFNIYAPRIDPDEWAFLDGLGRPAIIGEFHFGALDRGMFHTGLVATASQEARAAMFADYVVSVLDHPALVGCHWFQYVDEPLTGRTFDGENYNIGFVTVTDTPYPELVASARSILGAMYPRRARSARILRDPGPAARPQGER